jgi:hypothetical protein
MEFWESSDTTEFVRIVRRGFTLIAGELLPLVYDGLRKLAVRRLNEEKTGQTLQATALVHEAYLPPVADDWARASDSRGRLLGFIVDLNTAGFVPNQPPAWHGVGNVIPDRPGGATQVLRYRRK